MMNQSGEKTENSFRKVVNFFSKPRKQVSDSRSSSTSLGHQRSHSFTSTAFLGNDLKQGSLSSPSNHNTSTLSRTANSSDQEASRLSRSRAPIPERRSKSQQLDVAAVLYSHGLGRPSSSSSIRNHNDSSGSSSNCSSNTIIDRYVDVGQTPQQEKSKVTSSHQRNCIENGSGGCGRRPPRVLYHAPDSPIGNDKPRSYSCREAKGSCHLFSSRDRTENAFEHESTQGLAKKVVEGLSRYHGPKASSWESNDPITIDDVYVRSCFDFDSDVLSRKSYSLDEPYERVYGYYDKDDLSGFEKSKCLKPIEIEQQMDTELQMRSMAAEERVTLLSAELERKSFLQDGVFNVPTLIQTIKNLTEEKMHLALEVSGLLQSQMVDRATAKEELRLAKAELESQTRRLEKEKGELQLALEKELDRRSSDWSLKVERYKLEEQRLRERVRELAEQNVSLQREVSSLSERESESVSMLKYSEQQLKDLTASNEGLTRANQALRKTLPELEDKCRAAEDDRDCMKRNFEEKGKECRELHKSITRLIRTCSDQEKTIDGLREGLSKEIGKKLSLEMCDEHVSKLQTEQLRLTGVELALRRDVESYRREVDSLRHENISLLDRLKGSANDIGVLTYKLDREMRARIGCLQSQGLSMLNESSLLSSKLLEFIKGKLRHQEIKHGIEAIKNGLDGQFIIESEIKVQGFKRGTESLTRSLQELSSLLHEKCNPIALKSQSHCTDSDGSGQLNDQTSEDIIKSELKAERLLTSLLRDKLYSKELEVEQLQAELATSVRGNDILRFEVENAVDNLSCGTLKLKDLELEMLKKDESASQVQSSLQEYIKELTIMRGMLPKISQERDMMWEEVKQYSENNMLLNSEVNALKKKIEALDEDVLIKEGQITILKDSLSNNTSFDLLASPDNTLDFWPK